MFELYHSGPTMTLGPHDQPEAHARAARAAEILLRHGGWRDPAAHYAGTMICGRVGNSFYIISYSPELALLGGYNGRHNR